MAERHEVFQVTCPPGVPQSAPVETDTSFLPAVVESIEVHWPTGHASLTGLQIAFAHQQLVPYTTGAFILSTKSDRLFHVPPSANSGAWSVFLYNTDLIAHYWQVVFDVSDIPSSKQASAGPKPMLRHGDIYATANRPLVPR